MVTKSICALLVLLQLLILPAAAAEPGNQTPAAKPSFADICHDIYTSCLSACNKGDPGCKPKCSDAVNNCEDPKLDGQNGTPELIKPK
jgi:hypothetical protein